METTEITALVQRVQSWPSAKRLLLARRILETLDSSTDTPLPQPRGPSALEAAAMFRSDRLPPDDAAVKQWIDEHRREKYGS